MNGKAKHGGWPYSTNRWRSLRAAKLALMPVCESCGGYQDLEVHHRDGLTVDDRESRNEERGFPPPALLKVYCKNCHAKITRGVSKRELTASHDWAAFIYGD